MDVPIRSEADVFRARAEARLLAQALGFGDVDVHCIVTSVSELATNLFFHAGGGTIQLQRVDDRGPGIQVRTLDQGPGISNVLLAIRDGYSEGGGLGSGLPGVNRLMDELEIHSAPRQGTEVTARKYLQRPGREAPPAHDGWRTVDNPSAYGKVYVKQQGTRFLFQAR